MNRLFLKLFIIGVITTSTSAQYQKDRVCSSLSSISHCEQLQRGNSEVNCVYAQDAIECAQRIRNGTAEFGVFSAENAYHIASMGWEELTVIKEIRHQERLEQKFDFQSVVVVRNDHTGGVNSLRGMEFCHPGLQYGPHQKWSERFLKHFERTVIPSNCSFDGVSPVEVEVAGLAEFFSAACRPGSWSNNPVEDQQLKAKYPRLCSLCPDPSSCAYDDSSSESSHKQALECVRKSTNGVTYVSLKEAQDFFESDANAASQFSFLCPNGTIQPIASNDPCVWLSQPWKLILSNNQKAISLSKSIDAWMRLRSDWETYLERIIISDLSKVVAVNNIVRLPDYISPIRPIPIAIETCPTSIRWCTHSFEEAEKCDIIRMAALTTGIIPNIICNKYRTDTVTCISDVSSNKADFVGIDSNFGYLARHPYNLTAALFEETDSDKYSSVVVVIKEKDADKIKSFEDFKNKKACFAEFGGIASIAFINIAKSRGIFKRDECEFGSLLGEYFVDSCFPGSRSLLHDPFQKNPESMCKLCQTNAVTTEKPIRPQPMADQVNNGDEVEKIEGQDDDANKIEGQDDKAEVPLIPFTPDRSINCAAESSNRYYGNKGALSCLNELGDIAVIEHQKLNEHALDLNMDPQKFRIICRNGSLASVAGFDVDRGCFLTTIVDGEIVMRRNTSKSSSVVNVLLSLDKYLQNDPDFKMYNIFSGVRNLLFEDSSVGLASPTSSHEKLSSSVKSYIKLFEDIENCIEVTSSSRQASVNTLLAVSLFVLTMSLRN